MFSYNEINVFTHRTTDIKAKEFYTPGAHTGIQRLGLPLNKMYNEVHSFFCRLQGEWKNHHKY
jgi:hypothetical protein